MAGVDNLPDYASSLSDYHRAFAKELCGMIADLPVQAGDRILDVACGDAIYSRWLAERTGPDGNVLAVDLSPAFLELARTNTVGHKIQFLAANIERLPFADNTFDLVFCAQSLYSLPDPVEVVRMMRRVARPGGTVAVLENDTLHHILLPWPIEVELAVRGAELSALAEESGRPRKFYVGRQLNPIFRDAGLRDVRKATYATNRQAPLAPDERSFLETYLSDLLGRTRGRLDPEIRTQFERMADPGCDEFLLSAPDLSITCLDHVVRGVKPG